jgi:hypothetical protein
MDCRDPAPGQEGRPAVSAIEASSVRVSTLADGTLRLTVDIEPRHARAAFELFGSPGVPMALAALKAPDDEEVAEPLEEPEKTVGGPLSRLAGIWCSDPEFWRWLKVNDQEQAAIYVRMVCGVESRAQLDHDDEAAEMFHQKFRIPFSKHLQGRS